MSHPAQAKYGACKANAKDGRPCGLAIVRGGLCMFHQPKEVLARALKKLERNRKQRDAIVKEIQQAHDSITP